MFFPTQPDARIAEIAPVVPECRHCKSVMQITGIFPHPRFPRVEIVSFKCECGSAEKRVVPHSYKDG
jgi:hypothetical protein